MTMTTYSTRRTEDARYWQHLMHLQQQDRAAQTQNFLVHHLLPEDSHLHGDDTLLDGISWGENPLPPGWRRHQTRPGVITPDQSTDQGIRIAQDLGSIPHTNGLLLLPGGMPGHWIEHTHFYRPHVRLVQEVLWVTWPQPLPKEVDLDLSVWEQHP